jgi:hypothetical protein
VRRPTQHDTSKTRTRITAGSTIIHVAACHLHNTARQTQPTATAWRPALRLMGKEAAAVDRTKTQLHVHIRMSHCKDRIRKYAVSTGMQRQPGSLLRSQQQTRFTNAQRINFFSPASR